MWKTGFVSSVGMLVILETKTRKEICPMAAWKNIDRRSCRIGYVLSGYGKDFRIGCIIKINKTI